MTVIVLGASGMLGHKMLQVLDISGLEVTGTLRKHTISPILDPILDSYNLYYGVDAGNFSTVSGVLDDIDPDVIVNCIGIIKQLPESNDWDISHAINTEFPHKLSIYAHAHNMKLIHISTDCVFDGKKGGYEEVDIPNAADIYGRTKFAGEVPDALTLRTSIIGRELGTRHGLLEWFLSKRGTKIQGYKKSIFSGVTTNELSKLVFDIIHSRKNLIGLYHVAARPISKFDLLTKINYYLENKVDIEAVDGEIIDRSLNGHKLKCAFEYIPPDWDEMLKEMLIIDHLDEEL
jgi:dTDP-4-dehydrorhamnose reductase